MGSSYEQFKVEVKSKDVVAADLPLQQEHLLSLLNLELLIPVKDVGLFFCYKKPISTILKDHDDFSSMVTVLKKSLAQALVSYYLFAVELVSNSASELELLCNNRGVDFIEAYADVDLWNIDLYKPDATVEGKLVPKNNAGVFSVQAMELRCGGIVVACVFNHLIADAYSTNMFLVAWAEIARLNATSPIPSHRRSLLNPRRPLFYDVSSLDDMYPPASKLPPRTPKEANDDHQLISRIYYVTAKDIEWLQSQASNINDSSSSGSYMHRSKLESFSAFLWQIIAKSVSYDDTNKRCTIGIVVDGRRRPEGKGGGELQGDDKTTSPPMAMAMDTYVGNVISLTFLEVRAEELKSRPLSWAANAVHECVKCTITKEHFLGLIDWVEAHRPEPVLPKLYYQGSEGGPAFVVSSGQRFPVSKVDFGWGKPVFGSYHFPRGGEAGYTMPMPSAHGNGDWVVYANLLKGQLEFLEAEAAGIFRPFTSDYIHLL